MRHIVCTPLSFAFSEGRRGRRRSARVCEGLRGSARVCEGLRGSVSLRGYVKFASPRVREGSPRVCVGFRGPRGSAVVRRDPCGSTWIRGSRGSVGFRGVRGA
jgi:hypothetical protein